MLSRTRTRIRAGGVVIPKSRLIKDAQDERESYVEHKKLRIAGLPNRRAGHLTKR
jgi:hypothetical protein